MLNAPFQVYDAAAGSGKTFTLVKEFLKKVLVSKNAASYKNLLAVTFTNKAVAEMKHRIIDGLVQFSEENDAVNNAMLTIIKEEIGLSKKEIRERSQKVLKHILHNYSAFGVETIDSFNHRIIRTFARDLKLATNFEISLDAPQLLAEAVDRLISKAGEDKAITKVLIDFALQKTDEDKSWDITFDIYNAAQILLRENDLPYVEKLRNRTLSDFINFKKAIQKKNKISENEISEIAAKTLQLISDNGFEFDDFSNGFLPKYFQKLGNQDYNVTLGLAWQNNLEDKPLYPQRLLKSNPGSAARLDELQANFKENFDATVPLLQDLQFNQAILKNITALSVLNLVNTEYQNLKKEENLVTVNDFNTLVYDQIKDQPAPFIYERLGERYGHYFIDEFQDTSKLQWLNLKPLVENALSQQYESNFGSLLLVGDAKQSIYRWRGGVPEQFMDLCNEENPFPSVLKNVANLETNRRSREKIVTFNNEFFSFVANYFGDAVHKNLYEIGNRQKLNSKENGYVKLQFIEKQNKQEKNETYAQLVVDTVKNCTENGYSLSDICILTRSRIDGINIGVALMEAEIKVISSETLLIQNSIEVQLLISAINLIVNFDTPEHKVHLLNILYGKFSKDETSFLDKEEKHLFLKRFLSYPLSKFTEELKKFGIHFNIEQLSTLSLYETFETCIRNFKLSEKADAFIFAFMDIVFDFEQQKGADKLGFLDYWETKREKTSIPASSGINAVQIMTIHKSKGLEFPIVIFPYADIDIYRERSAKVWYPLQDPIEKFEEAHISYNTALSGFGEIGATMHAQFRQTLELDNINLLYVTLTRAVDQLYIFSEKPIEPKELPSTYNQFFLLFLKEMGKWNDDTMIYEFGTFVFQETKKNLIEGKQRTPNYISTPYQNHSLIISTHEADLWETERLDAIVTGDLLHNTLQHIITVDDIEKILLNLKARSTLTSDSFENLKTTITALVNHSELKHLFNGDDIVYNEKDIITKTGNILRPDRLNFHANNSVTIIDYKTGVLKESHANQINEYGNALVEMDYEIASKMIVYTHEKDIVINKV